MRTADCIPVLMWNPINLVDGEGHWLGLELVLILGALVLSKLFGIFLRRVEKRFPSPFFGIAAEALYRPALCLLWYLVAIHSFDLVTDQLLSSGKPRLWTILFNGGTVLAIGWFLLRLKNGLIAYMGSTSSSSGKFADTHLMVAISKILTVAIAIIVLVLLHDTTGMNLTTFLAFGGVGGLALAFASQEIVSNFFGGFMIHLTRPFLIGELISMPANAIEGTVEEIGWYQTRLRSTSRAALYAPNSLFTKALLINKSRITHRLLEEPIAISMPSSGDIRHVLGELERILSHHPQCDHSEWFGARIRSFHGNTCELTVHGLILPCSVEEFYALRNEILISCAEIVTSCGGTFAPSAISIGSAFGKP